MRLQLAGDWCILPFSTGRGCMVKKLNWVLGVAALLAAFCVQAQVAIDNDDIGGVVRGPGGPEAGVWVIAETRDLPVRFIRIVVTDDQGRYVIPDLPKGKY